MQVRPIVALFILSSSCQFDASGSPPSGAILTDASLDAPSPVVIDGALHDALEPDAMVPDCWTNTDYVEGPMSDHRYRVFTDTAVDWMTALDRCIADQSHLVVVDSIEENDYLETLIGTHFWIGLHDNNIEDEFEWVTSAPLDFENWNDNEPNDAGNNEDCVELRDSHGMWNDRPCSDGRYFICECDPTLVP